MAIRNRALFASMATWSEVAKALGAQMAQAQRALGRMMHADLAHAFIKLAAAQALLLCKRKLRRASDEHLAGSAVCPSA